MAFLQITKRDENETIMGVYKSFQDLNDYLQAQGYTRRTTVYDFKTGDIVLTPDYYIELIYRPYPRYFLQAVTSEEYGQADIKALENNTRGLAFVCLVQDDTTLDDIRELLQDYAITAASFETYTGDYEPLFVRYGQPSFRDDNSAWLRVRWTR